MDLIHICKIAFLYDAADLCSCIVKECNETNKKKELVVFNEMPFNIVK